MSKNHKPKGPKYSRYFFAYSDKLIVNGLGFPLSDLNFIFGGGLNRYIALGSNIMTINLPRISGDYNGQYGVIILPEKEDENFLWNGPAHLEKRLSPRELNPSVQKLTYLTDFDPNNRALGGDFGFGAQIGEEFTCCTLIPYREAAVSICDLLDSSGFQCKGQVSSRTYPTKRLASEIHIHSIGQNKKDLEDQFPGLMLS